MTFGAGFRRCARRRSAAVTIGTNLNTVYVHLAFTALCGLLKRDSNARLQILASSRTVRIGSSAAAEATGAAAEKAGEDVTQIKIVAEAAVEAATACAEVRVNSGMTVLVITSLFLLIAEHLVGFVCLLELRLGFLVAGVQVGMVLLGLFTVSLFYFVGACVFVNAKHLIVISFISHKLKPLT